MERGCLAGIIVMIVFYSSFGVLLADGPDASDPAPVGVSADGTGYASEGASAEDFVMRLMECAWGRLFWADHCDIGSTETVGRDEIVTVGGDILFSGGGKFVVESGGTLLIDLSTLNFSVSGDGEVLVLKPGSRLSVALPFGEPVSFDIFNEKRAVLKGGVGISLTTDGIGSMVLESHIDKGTELIFDTYSITEARKDDKASAFQMRMSVLTVFPKITFAATVGYDYVFDIAYRDDGEETRSQIVGSGSYFAGYREAGSGSFYLEGESSMRMSGGGIDANMSSKGDIVLTSRQDGSLEYGSGSFDYLLKANVDIDNRFLIMELCNFEVSAGLAGRGGDLAADVSLKADRINIDGFGTGLVAKNLSLGFTDVFDPSKLGSLRLPSLGPEPVMTGSPDLRGYRPEAGVSAIDHVIQNRRPDLSMDEMEGSLKALSRTTSDALLDDVFGIDGIMDGVMRFSMGTVKGLLGLSQGEGTFSMKMDLGEITRTDAEGDGIRIRMKDCDMSVSIDAEGGETHGYLKADSADYAVLRRGSSVTDIDVRLDLRVDTTPEYHMMEYSDNTVHVSGYGDGDSYNIPVVDVYGVSGWERYAKTGSDGDPEGTLTYDFVARGFHITDHGETVDAYGIRASSDGLAIDRITVTCGVCDYAELRALTGDLRDVRVSHSAAGAEGWLKVESLDGDSILWRLTSGGQGIDFDASVSGTVYVSE